MWVDTTSLGATHIRVARDFQGKENCIAFITNHNGAYGHTNWKWKVGGNTDLPLKFHPAAIRASAGFAPVGAMSCSA